MILKVPSLHERGAVDRVQQASCICRNASNKKYSLLQPDESHEVTLAIRNDGIVGVFNQRDILIDGRRAGV